jgi:hypothetical protein
VGRAQSRDRSELVALLAEQRAALAASCESFDKGNSWEAPRLATAVFNLVHDGGSIKSLLTQLGLRASLRFISSGRFEKAPNLISSSPPLVLMHIGQNGAKFLPKLSELHGRQKIVQFETWWSKETIFGNTSLSLTRRNLVFSLRHQDGGSHIGALTDTAYMSLKAGDGWFGGRGNSPPKPLDGGAAATMRQVAWELTETLIGVGDVT